MRARTWFFPYGRHSREVSDETEGQAGGRTIRAGVFAKLPQAGQVKTRLSPILGAKGAAEFARALLDDAVGRLCGAPSEGVSGELVFTPAEERDWFTRTYPSATLRAQVGAGLAERLESWFETVLRSQPAPFAAAIGSDSPWTSRARVAAAAQLLGAGADVVLGPDLGGGYYLVALARPVPGLFTAIQMSTRTMFEETCDWVRARGFQLGLLEADYDVDDAADWERLVNDLQQERASPGHEPAAVQAFVRGWLARNA